MAIDQRFFDELLYRCDIVDVISGYVPLKRSGANYTALCPFHNEKTPSFSVSREKQIFKCFGCGEGGNAISFIMKIENLQFIDAVRLLADRCGMEVPEESADAAAMKKQRQRLLELNRDAAIFYNETLNGPDGAQARQYLAGRGILPRTVKMFGLGYAPESWDSLISAMTAKGYSKEELERAKLAGRGKSGGLYDFFRGRLMFPVIDARGGVVAFGGRVLRGDGDGRKYINSPDTPVYNKSRTLYGLNLAKKSKAKRFILCEGNIDVIAMHQAGFDSAVASCGTAFTDGQARLMRDYTTEVVICYDADAAGQKATEKAIDILKAAGFGVRVLKIPPKKDENGRILLDGDGRPLKNDPDDFIRANGGEAFAALLDKTDTDGQYRMGEIRAKHNIETDEGRIAFLKEATAYIAGIGSDIEREILARGAAREAKISEESVMREIERTRGSRVKSERKKNEKRALSPLQSLQPQARELRYSNPASAHSEELLIAAVLDSVDALDYAAKNIGADEFSAEYLAKIYKTAVERREMGLEVNAAACMIGLSDNEASRLAEITSGEVRAKDPVRAAADYIEKIHFEYKKRQGGDDVLMMAALMKRDLEDKE